MKKLFYLIASFCLICSFTACQANEPTKSPEDSVITSTPSVEATTTPTSTPSPTPEPVNELKEYLDNLSESLEHEIQNIPEVQETSSSYDAVLNLSLHPVLQEQFGIFADNLNVTSAISATESIAKIKADVSIEKDKNIIDIIGGEFYLDVVQNQFFALLEELSPIAIQGSLTSSDFSTEIPEYTTEEVKSLCLEIKKAFFNAISVSPEINPAVTIGLAPYAVTGTEYTLTLNETELINALQPLLLTEDRIEEMNSSESLYTLRYIKESDTTFGIELSTHSLGDGILYFIMTEESGMFYRLSEAGAEYLINITKAPAANGYTGTINLLDGTETGIVQSFTYIVEDRFLSLSFAPAEKSLITLEAYITDKISNLSFLYSETGVDTWCSAVLEFQEDKTSFTSQYVSDGSVLYFGDISITPTEFLDIILPEGGVSMEEWSETLDLENTQTLVFKLQSYFPCLFGSTSTEETIPQ